MNKVISASQAYNNHSEVDRRHCYIYNSKSTYDPTAIVASVQFRVKFRLSFTIYFRLERFFKKEKTNIRYSIDNRFNFLSLLSTNQLRPTLMFARKISIQKQVFYNKYFIFKVLIFRIQETICGEQGDATQQMLYAPSTQFRVFGFVFCLRGIIRRQQKRNYNFLCFLFEFIS